MPEHPMQDSAPTGWRYVDFRGGSLDGQYRLIKGEPAFGDSYELVATGEQYRFNGEVFAMPVRTMPGCGESSPSGGSE